MGLRSPEEGYTFHFLLNLYLICIYIFNVRHDR